MDVRFRPLVWTGPVTPPDKRRSRHSFKASWPNTLDLLQRELEQLEARDVVIEADFQESDIRIDGWPRANARQPENPGVRIAFGSKHGPLVYATDSCAFWQHNVRSIALGLEALRAVDRYGVTKRGEQYTGWRALPPGSSPAPADQGMSREDAATVVLNSAGMRTQDPINRSAILRDGDLRGSVFAKARRASHPDTGGSGEAFARLQEAIAVLEGSS
jgi:hypothetical protein